MQGKNVKIFWYFFGGLCFFVIVLSYIASIFLYGLFGTPICDSWHSDMEREEKILLALEHVSKSNSTRFEIQEENGRVHFTLQKQILQKSPTEIMKEQPDCCKLYSSLTAHSESPSETLPPDDKGVAYIKYTGSFIDPATKKAVTAKVSTYFDFNTCRD